MDEERYFQMRAYLLERENNRVAELKIGELENVWHCTLKNVKRKLKQFEENGKIIYEPGRGRGNLSKIVFTSPFWEEFEKAVDIRVEQDRVDEVIKLLQMDIPEGWRNHFSKKIPSLFGLQIKQESKDILRTIMTRNLTTLDPLYSSITVESYLIQQFGDTLVNYNEREDRIEPHLAHSWESLEDNKVWIFYLRKGVRFHHQKLLTSWDVQYTFERFQKEDLPYYWLVEDIEKIECPNETTICFTLKHSNPFFIRYVSSSSLVILPNDVPFDEWNWIGTGPFKMKERTEAKLVIEAFDDYFKERPLLDEVQFWRVPPNAVKGITFQVEQSEEQSSSERKEDIESGFRFLAFNFHRFKYAHDASFREAMYHLFNMQKMWKDLQRNHLVEASSFLPERSAPLKKNASFIPKLLRNSSYQGEEIITYALHRKNAKEGAEWFKQEASRYGVNISIKLFHIEDLYTANFEQQADLLFLGEVATMDKHLSFLGAFYNKALIFRRFLSPAHLNVIDSMLEDVKRGQTKEEREKKIIEIENYIKTNNLFIFLYHPIKTRFFHPMIKNIEVDSFTQINLRKLWVKPELGIYEIHS